MNTVDKELLQKWCATVGSDYEQVRRILAHNKWQARKRKRKLRITVFFPENWHGPEMFQWCYDHDNWLCQGNGRAFVWETPRVLSWSI